MRARIPWKPSPQFTELLFATRGNHVLHTVFAGLETLCSGRKQCAVTTGGCWRGQRPRDAASLPPAVHTVFPEIKHETRTSTESRVQLVPGVRCFGFDFAPPSRVAGIAEGGRRLLPLGPRWAAHCWAAVARVHPEIQHKKPHCQYSLYQECGFLYSISCRLMGREIVPAVRVAPGPLSG
eukprot:497401-Rhodomonas_salina.1